MTRPLVKGYSHASNPSGVAYARGTVLGVDRNIAVVQMATNQVNVRADLLRGKGAAPRPGETWILDQQYGQWMFAVCIGYLGGGKFAADIGDGASTTITVAHDLRTKDITLSLRANATDTGVATGWSWTAATEDTVVLTFATAPALNAYRVVVLA